MGTQDLPLPIFKAKLDRLSLFPHNIWIGGMMCVWEDPMKPE
jgi:hypothetical protein